MRTASYNAEELERQIGPIGATSIDSSNRGMVQNWLVAQGVPSARVKTMRLGELCNAYNKPDHLAVILARQPEQQPQEEATATMPRDLLTHDDNSAEAILSRAIQDIAARGKAPLDEARVIELVREHAPRAETAITEIQLVAPNGTVTTLDNEPRHCQFAQVLRAIQCGNVFLRGPAGSGKTTIAHQIAKALNRAFYFTGAVASEYKLTGFMNAQGVYIRTAFREAYERGGLFLFDEIDASAPAALLAFNTALANGHMDFPDGIIERHPDFLCIAAGNTYGQGADRVYVGRSQLDGATLDRFLFIDLDYDEALERAIAGNEGWVDIVQRVRRAVAVLKLRHVVSPRASIMGTKLIAAGASIAETKKLALWRNLDAETVAKIEAQA